ncbi:MAG: hypothetical protein U0Z26_15090 [Anaerolineales bacterium]
MSRPLNQISTDQAVAICTREQAAQLVAYDHHVVVVLGKPGVMLTREWNPIEEKQGPFILTVVFHGVEKYPSVPETVQRIVDALRFQVRGQPR